MSTLNKQEHIILDLGDFSGGMNTKDPAHAIKSNQAQMLLNAVAFSQGGLARAPGKWGLNATPQHGAPIKGLFQHKKLDGTTQLIAVSDQDIDTIATTDGARTKLFDIGGTGNAVADNAFGTLFVANGTEVAKVEGSAAYKVGIAAPTGSTAAKLAGGSLPAGVYQVAVSYARKVSGSNVLYSLPQIIGAVTLSAADLSIRVTVANSADPQVNNKVVWITGVGLTSPYYWAAESNNNTSITIDVTSDTRNLFIIMDAVAADNYQPAAFAWLTFFDNRIYGLKDNRVYYSRQAGTVYDLEVFPAANYKDFAFKCLSIFPLGEHIFVNTVNGLYLWPYGDPLEREWRIDSYLYFKYPYSVAQHNGMAYGVTNDGIRYFNGSTFSIDISKHIKPDIDSLVAGASSDFEPFGVVMRREGIRTEYHVSYRDTVVSSTVHNTDLVLNIDSLVVQDNDNYRAAFEKWTPGWSHAVEYGTDFYIAQSISGGGLVAKELSTDVNDKYVYSTSGALLAVATDKRIHTVGKMEIPDILGTMALRSFYALCKINFAAKFRSVIPDNGYRLSEQLLFTPSQGNLARLNTEETLLDFYLPTFSPIALSGKFDMAQKGKSVYFEIDQTANDPDFAIYKISIVALNERNEYK